MLGCRNAPSLIYPYLMHAGDHTHARTTNPRLFNSILPWIMHASDTHFDPVEILKRRADDAHTLFCITCEYVCNSPQKKKKGNSYLKKQIRGAKDKIAQIPCRASVHPCIQRVPGHRPATGAALTGCGRTQREAAGAVTAGVVVTHPAKIQVIGMGEGKKQKDIASKPHQVLTDIPLLPSTLISPPLLPFYTSFKHH